MLKINLLPPYVRERKRIRNTVLVLAPVLLLVVAGMVGWMYRLNGDIQEVKAKTDALSRKETRVNELTTEIQAVETSNTDLLTIVTFIDNVRKYNLELPRVLEQVASWTYAKVQITGWELAGGAGTFDHVNMQCRTDSIDSLYKALDNLWNATHLFSQVTLSQVTPSISFPPGQSGQGGMGGTRTFGGPPFGGGPLAPGGMGGSGLNSLLATEQGGLVFNLSFMLRTPIQIPDMGAAMGQGGVGGPAGGGAPPPPAGGAAAPPSGGPPTAPGGGAPGGGAAGGRGLGGGRGGGDAGGDAGGM